MLRGIGVERRFLRGGCSLTAAPVGRGPRWFVSAPLGQRFATFQAQLRPVSRRRRRDPPMLAVASCFSSSQAVTVR